VRPRPLGEARRWDVGDDDGARDPRPAAAASLAGTRLFDLLRIARSAESSDELKRAARKEIERRYRDHALRPRAG
jgi:hypothetical protein